MYADTVCLRCHQKCLLTAEVIDGKIVGIMDHFPENRIPPCREACPIGMDIPGYNYMISQGRFKEAMNIIRDTNPLPSVCGRVCPHPCEMDCNRSPSDGAVANQWLKRFATDHMSKHEKRPLPTPRTKKEKIAIIGSGPAGLTAAHDLVKAGYEVIVFEEASAAGGMMVRCIPEFRLPGRVVQRDIDFITGLGVQIQTHTSIGKDRTLADLLDQYDAVLISIGSWNPVPLKIPGAGLDGVRSALSVLEYTKQGRQFDLGDQVVVIGGGNTAFNAARAALRMGASQVHVTCLENRSSMPAHDWEIEEAEREGIILHPSLAPQRFCSRDGKNVSSIDFHSVASTDVATDGKITWTLKQGPGSRATMDADRVIIAIGQRPLIDLLAENGTVKMTAQGTVAVNSATLTTQIPGLFAAGDVVAGEGTIVESIAMGRKAALSIMHYLGCTEGRNLDDTKRKSALEPQMRLDFGGESYRRVMPMVPGSEAIKSFEEVALGYSEHEAMEEANRCMNCVTPCIKGATIPDIMYHPDRLLYPLKRVGQRGEGKWERISWDEALDNIAGSLKEIRERYGPETIHLKSGSGQKHLCNLTMAILGKLLSLPNTHSGSYLCTVPGTLGGRLSAGESLVYEYNQDYEHANCIVFWGSNPDAGVPAQLRKIRTSLRNGAKLLVIDPRPTPMAKRADLWLQIRPGTDAALALGMLHVIIKEELYDQAFIKHYSEGFDLLANHVRQCTPQWASEITWLKAEDIVQAARMYATIKPATIYGRNGTTAQQHNATQTTRLMCFLIALCGNIDVPGGNLLWARTYIEGLFWYSYGLRANMQCAAVDEGKRIGAEEYPMMNDGNRCDMPLTFQAIAKDDIKAVWCFSTNLIVEEPNSREIAGLLKNKMDLFFVSDFFMTPTAELADFVLPAAYYTEVDTLVEAFSYPSNYVTASRKVVDPPGECRDDRWVAIELAKRMGVDVSPWNSVKDFEDWRLKYLGLSFDEVWERPHHRIYFPREFKRYERSNPPFPTPSGKFEFYSSVAESLGSEAIPIHKEPPQSPVSTPDTYKAFPLIYVQYRSINFMHTEGRQVERQRRISPDPSLEINSDTASKLGIKQGDWVYLETPYSGDNEHLQYKARLVQDMHPNIVAGPHGWWFPEKPGPEHGCFDSNINALIPLAPPFDPLEGTPQCRSILCRVRRIDRESNPIPMEER